MSTAEADQVVAAIRNFVETHGFIVHGVAPSRLLGPKGNQEYFFHLTTQ